MIGRVAAAAAGDVEPALLGEVAHERAHVLGELGEAGGRERIGQAGIGIATDVTVCYLGKFLDIGAHLGGPESAVNPDGQWLGMPDGIPKGLNGLS